MCCESWTKFSAQTSCGEQDNGYTAEIPDRLNVHSNSGREQRLGTLSSKCEKKKLIQKHFRPKTLSSKNTFVQNHFIQNRRQFHPMTLSSKNTFIQKHFRPKPFHPKQKTISSNDTFIQKRFHPMTLSSKNGFVQ